MKKSDKWDSSKYSSSFQKSETSIPEVEGFQKSEKVPTINTTKEMADRFPKTGEAFNK